jgi:exopolyphosphatase/pppGpp-phosphohydrolase
MNRPDELTEKSSFDLQGQADRLAAVRVFAHCGEYEEKHCEQVAYLADCLAEGLSALWHFSDEERFWLTCGAILHDIGWKEGQQKHHKTSMQIILSDRTMPLDLTERKIIALVARYHRKALPLPTHPVYDKFSGLQQQMIDRLAGIVRLADGLDRTHAGVIREIAVEIKQKRIDIICKNSKLARLEIKYGMEKADLLRRVTGYRVEITGLTSLTQS